MDGVRPTSEGRHRVATVIDDDGQVWNLQDPRLHRRLGARPNSSFDLATYLAQALGWVAMWSNGKELVFGLNPSLAAPAAVGTMKKLISSKPAVEIVLSIEHAQIRAGSGAQALGSIEDLVSAPSPARVGPRFHSEQRPMEQLYRERRSGLLCMLTKGRSLAHKRIVGSEAVVAVARSDQRARTSVNHAFACSRSSFRWIAEYLAPALTFLDESDRHRIVATEMRRSPDSAYAAWCTNFYERNLTAGEPTLDFVRARIHTTAGPPVDTSYMRLMQPFRTRDDGWLVLTSTETVPVVAVM